MRFLRLPAHLLLITVLLSVKVFSQDFKTSPLVTIPGDNRNFSIASPIITRQSHNSFICWENRLGSKYTIYLKQIDPLEDSIYTVWSDTMPNTSPVISYNREDSSVNVVWQSYKNARSVLYSRNFKNKSFNEASVLTDTLKNSISPSLSNHALVWIEDGKLLYKTTSSEITVVDSINCANPVIYPYYEMLDATILYEKGEIGQRQIYRARYVGQIREQKPYWEITKVSEGTDNINPSWAPFGEYIYQTKENSVWKLVITGFDPKKPVNVSCNFEHPTIFDYPIITGNSGNNSFPFFLAFDTDSIQGNKEIFVEYHYIPDYRLDTLINFSNSPGDDIKPKAAYFNHSPYTYSSVDNAEACIVWEHIENNKSDIWWAVSPCKINLMDVNDNQVISKFRLSQNFPNPFNPATIISYSIAKRSFVDLKVFDILGREVITLVSKEQSAGEYKVEFDGSNLPSGMYVYQLRTGNYSETKKMLLLR
ncbi:MAG: T9SS type A sorting domain-containing protein [Syntrophothermus sp.]